MIPVTTRELVLKWKSEGKTQQQMANLAGCNQSAISRLLVKYLLTGSVKNIPRSGRPTPLNKKMLSTIKKEFINAALSANKKYCSVDVKQFASMLRKRTHKQYTMRHVARILHKLDFSRTTPRPQHVRHDQKKVDTFRREFKKNSTPSTWVMRL